MPIALMFPFAEAAGITLTGLGIAKATDIIMNYIQANPEKSKQILSTLMPNVVGIGSMLMKEKSEGTSDEEQPKEQKDTRSKKEIVLDAVREGREGRGNYSSPDAEGPAVSIRGNVIRGLEDAGKVSKERKTPEEMEKENKTKKPFDYKKFYKADGGRIGYQVGGAAVLDYLRGVEGSDATDGRVNYASDSTEKLIQDYMNATQNRTNRLANPNKIQDLINRYTGGGQRTYDQMIGSGQGDIRGSRIPFGIGSLLSQILPDRYYDMSLGDQAFTQSQMGYTGPTVFGQNTGNQDPFGINVRSAFGNYGEAVQKEFDSLNSSLNDRLAQKYGVTFDPNRGIYLGENADIANRQTQMMRDKFNFRKDQLVKRADIDSRSKAAIANKEKIAEIIRDNKQYFSGPNATTPTPTNNNDRRNTSNDTNPNPSTPGAQDSFSNTSGKGRTGYFFGGRIGFVEGGDVMEETSGKNLSDYISGQGQYTSGSKTPEPGVKIKEELSNFIFNLNIPLNEKIKLLGQLSTSNSRVVEDLKGIGYNKNVYKDKFDSKKIGVQYDNDGFTIGGMYDPENKSKDLFINYKKSFKEGGLISMFREKR
jgi:hypothetical protein